MRPFGKKSESEQNRICTFEMAFSGYGTRTRSLIERWIEEEGDGNKYEPINLRRESGKKVYAVVINDLRVMLPGPRFQFANSSWQGHFKRRFGRGALDGSIAFFVRESSKHPVMAYIPFSTLYKIDLKRGELVSAIEPRTYIDLERKCAVGFFPEKCSPIEMLQSDEITLPLEEIAKKYLLKYPPTGSNERVYH